MLCTWMLFLCAGRAQCPNYGLIGNWINSTSTPTSVGKTKNTITLQSAANSFQPAEVCKVTTSEHFVPRRSTKDMPLEPPEIVASNKVWHWELVTWKKSPHKRRISLQNIMMLIFTFSPLSINESLLTTCSSMAQMRLLENVAFPI
eukprot:GEMP01065159.1.p1 GENE.GEMP01065159.1~~GEMP01065159.1.p1  ORF type:complete len:146 (+),score=21.40 GEMP01065159.1:613-1050(+)